MKQNKVIAEFTRPAVVDARIFATISSIAQDAVASIRAYLRKVNTDTAAVETVNGKEALTLSKMKLKIFVPPMF